MTLGLVAVFPACLALVLLVVQAALIAHAHNVAGAAAQEGLRQARLYDGTPAAGRLSAQQFLTQTGSGLLTAATVEVTRTPDTATVQIRGRALSLLPGLHPTVEAVAVGPTERFVPDPGAP